MTMIILALVLGLLIGSFLNVCIYRIPRKEEIVYTPSHCMNCGKRISWYDLIPVMSYMLLHGKCRYCKEKLSLQYPVVELLNGAAYAWLYAMYGFSKETLICCALASVLIVISVIDLKHYIIPNGLVIALLVIGVVQVAIHPDRWVYYVIGFFAASLILFLLAIITRGKMGGGDIKLMAAAGLFLGWDLVLLSLMLGAVLGSVIGLSLIGFKVIRRDQMIPFGPFLSVGILISAIYGKQIIGWYLSLL